MDYRLFHHIEQLIQLDVHQNLITDVALLFLDRNDQVIERVEFRRSTPRPLGTEAVYRLIKAMVVDQEERPQSQPGSIPDEPSIDEKIHLRLQEINSALQAFDRCSGPETEDPAKPAKS